MLPALLAAGFTGLLATGGFIERPFTDFDTVVRVLAPHGQWTPHPEKQFVFRPAYTTPHSAWAPFRNGQWRYTDYGWTWDSSEPGSWATSHYGHWIKDPEGWAWVPGIHWLGATVEWIQSGDHLGWRPCPLDRFGNPIEPPGVRYADPAQWNFVPREKIRGPLTPADFASPAEAAALLVKANPADHIFVSYREIPRPGPDPQILMLADGRMPEFPVIRELLEHDLPPEAPFPNSYYLYRPRFHQDAEGVFRRVALFLNPRKENPEFQRVRETLTPGRELTPKEQKALRDAAIMEQAHQQHQRDIYR